MALEIETRLRKHIQEILQPINDRIGSQAKEMRTLDAKQQANSHEMTNLNHKIEKEVKVRDQVGEIHRKLLDLVSPQYPLTFRRRKQRMATSSRLMTPFMTRKNASLP